MAQLSIHRAVLVNHVGAFVSAVVVLAACCCSVFADDDGDILIIDNVDVAVPAAAEKADKPPAKPADAQPAAKQNADQAKKTDDAKAKKAEDAKKAAEKRHQEALKRRVVAQRQQAALAGNQNAIQQQIRARLEPMVKAELSFATRAAGLKDEERRNLIAASKKWFDGYLTNLIKNQDPQQQQMLLQGGNGVWFGGQGRNSEDPQKQIREGVAKLAAETLPNEKANAYEEECRKRDEFQRHVAVDNLVVRIDEKVILSPEQRGKITKALFDHFDQSSPPQLEAFAAFAGSSIWPGFNNEQVLPYLDESQRAVMSRINRNSGQMFFGGMGFGMDSDMIDDIDADFNAAFAAEPEKK